MSAVEEQWAQGPSLIESIWRYLPAIIVVTLGFGVGGYILSASQDPVYEATAYLVLTNPQSASFYGEDERGFDAERYVPQQVAHATSRPVLTRAANAQSTYSAEEIEEAVGIEGDLELNAFSITASGGTPDAASAIANTLAEAYMADVRARTYERARAAADSVLGSRQVGDIRVELGDFTLEQRAALEEQAAQILLDALLFDDGVQVFEEALAPEEPASPSPRRDAALAAMLGAALSSAVGYWRAGRLNRAESRSDPGRVLQAPLLGEIPLYKQAGSGTLAERLAVPARAIEAYQFVLSSLEFALSEVDGRTVLVTSASPADGKTTTALQLARSAARDEGRVVLVDSDVRARGLTRMLGAEGRRGLVEVSNRQVGAEGAIVALQPVHNVRLPFLPAGKPPADATSFFRSTGFRRALDKLSQDSELVILDSSPMLAVADSSIIANQVDGIVLVVTRGTPFEKLVEIRERLNFISTPLLGYVYNRSDTSRLQAYGYEYIEPSTNGSRSRRGKRPAGGEWTHVGTGSSRRTQTPVEATDR